MLNLRRFCLMLLAAFIPGMTASGQYLYVADASRVQTFTGSGAFVSQFAINGNGRFTQGPAGMAIDAKGNFWLTDTFAKTISEFDATGNYINTFGSYGIQNGQFLGGIEGIAADAGGNVWVVDSGNNRVQEFNSIGVYQSQFGSFGTGNGQFEGAAGIAIDSAGAIYVADGSRVQKFTNSGTFVSQFTINGNGRFAQGPAAMAVDTRGNFWLTDTFSKTISEFDAGGNYINTYGSYGTLNGQFLGGIEGIAVDGSGNVWVVDSGNNRVQEFNGSGVYQNQFGGFGTGNGQFQGAVAIVAALGAGAPVPSISSVVPASGMQGQTNLVVTISGLNTHFASGSSQVTFGPDITVNGVTVASPTSLTASITISASANLGAHTVTTITGSEMAILTNGFVVTKTSLPSITSVSPNMGQQGQQGLQVAITGQSTHFSSQTLLDFGPGITANSIQATDATHLSATINISDRPAWTEVDDGTTGPSPRRESTTVYDSVSHQLITFGGFNNAHLNDVWRLQDADGSGPRSWQHITPQGAAPSPRAGASSSYDVANDRMTIFGGFFGTTAPCTNETWVLANASGRLGVPTWIQLLPNNSPAPRMGQSSSYDPSSNRLIVYGGDNCINGGQFGDLWVLTNANGIGGPPQWIQLSTAGTGPGLREDAGASYDQANNRFILFGGFISPSRNFVGGVADTWVLTNANGLGGTPAWTKLQPPGLSPPFGYPYGAAYDGVSNHLVVISGTCNETEAWVLSNANGLAGIPSWRKLGPFATGPASRSNYVSSLIYDSITDRAIVTGGLQNAGYPDIVVYATDTWVLNSAARSSQTGPRTVSVATGLEILQAPSAFTVLSSLLSPVVSVNPSCANPGTTLTVEIDGELTAFQQGLTTATFGADLSVGGGENANFGPVTVTSPTSAQATVTVRASAPFGVRNVTVRTGTQDVSPPNGMFVDNNQLPKLLSVTPNLGMQGQALSVSIQGQNTAFSNASTIDFGPGISVNSASATDTTDISAQLTISGSAPLGARTVTVSTGDEIVTLANSFTVAASGVPMLSSVSPNSGQQGQGGPVAIVGQNTHFVQGTTHVSFGTGITVSNVTVSCPTCVTVTLAVAVTAPVGPHDVTVTTGSEVVTLPGGFTVVVGTPILTSLNPASGQQGQTFPFTVTGSFTHFTQGTTQVSLGTGVIVSAISVTSTTALTAQAAIDPATASGPRTLTVTTGAEVVTLTNGFTVVPTSPVLLTAIPSTGQMGQQNVAVAVTGQNTHFAAGISQVGFGSGITVGTVTVSSTTSLVAQITIAGNTTIGARTLTVTTGNETVSLPGAFTVGEGAPVVTTASGGCSQTIPILPSQITFTEYSLPSSDGGPVGITVGPDCNFWFTEGTGNKIGRISSTGAITEFPLPGQGIYGTGSSPGWIVSGPDGNLWFTEYFGQKIGRITVAGVITEYSTPTTGSFPIEITAGPDGNLWFTEYLANRIGRITPAGVITEFAVPSGGSYGAAGITAGPDGNLWFTECRCSPGATGNSYIGRITPTGVITEFPLPVAGSGPYAITTGVDGNLWFTDSSLNKIGRISPSGVITEFPVPSPDFGLKGLTTGVDGNLWFTEYYLNQIGRITPAGIVTEFPAPSGCCNSAWGIVSGPDGNLWFSEFTANKIGKINPLTGVATTTLSGSVTDDGYPSGASLTTSWSVTNGPGPVTFGTPSGTFPDVAGQANPVSTSATFTVPGTYTLNLAGNDSQLTASSNVTITVTPAAQTPAILSVTPNTGQQGQNNLSITVNGQFTNFVAGATVVSFGSDITVNSVTVLNLTSLTVNVTIPAVANIGAHTVTVTSGTQVVSLSNGFTVIAIPTITAVSPNSGQQGQGGPVGIVGLNTHFAQGTTQVSFGTGITVSNVSVSCPTCLTVTLAVAATAPTGSHDVTVTTGSEVVTLTGGFTVTPGTPILTSIVPNSVQQGQSASITITGNYTHFTQGTTTVNFGAGVTVSSVTVSNAGSLAAQIVVDPAAPITTRAVTVTTGTEVVTSSAVFSVLMATPVLYTLNPGGGTQGQQSLSVVITGLATHFVQGTSVATFGAGVTVASLTVASATSATAVINIDPAAVPGLRTVTVTTASEIASFTNGFSVSMSGPIIYTLNPGGSSQGATNLPVQITGLNTHFVQGTSVATFGAGITVVSLVVTNATTATATINIDVAAMIAPRTVTVTTGMEAASFMNGFTVTPGVPGITVINPGGGPQGIQNLSLALTAQFTQFVQGTTTATFSGTGITLVSLTVNSPLTATLVVNVAATAAVGARDVTVTTGTQILTAPGGFTVTMGTPVLLSANPSSGQQGQNLPVTLTGQLTHFVQGVTTVSFGAGITVNSVAVSSSTSVVATISIDPAATTGLRPITVTTGSEVVSLNNGFSVASGTAVITSVSPNIGQQGQTGLLVTITGQFTHFNSSTTQASFGAGVSITALTVNSATSLTASLSIDVAAALGTRGITVTTGSEVATLGAGFMIQQLASGPVSVNPVSGLQSQSLSVTITGTGTHFVQGTTQARFGPGISVGGGLAGDLGAVTVTSPTTATAQIIIVPTALPGSRTVTVQTGAEQDTGANAFVILGTPYLSNIAPTGAPQGLSGTVTINGTYTHFAQGTTQVSFGAGVTVTSVTVTTAGSLAANITIGAAATPGPRTVSVTTGAEAVSLPAGFSVFGPITGAGPNPTITSPAGGATITAPTPVTGTVTSPNLAYWTLAYQAPGSSAFTPFATGTSSAVTGTLDPTLLLNGSATIQLTGVDASGQSAAVAETYDASGNLKSETNALGYTHNYTYNSRNQVTSTTDPLLHQTANTYDSAGNLTQTQDANGKLTKYVYNGLGQRTSMTDATQAVTSYVYDASGNLSKQTDALNNITTYLYDANNNKISETRTRTTLSGPQSLVTQYQYDKLNRLTQTTYADGSATQIHYNAIGKQSVTTDQLGRQTGYQYDLMGRLVETDYADGTKETSSYDANGNRVSSTDRANRTTQYVYDSLNRLSKTIYPDTAVTSTQYDAIGEVTVVTDARGNQTQYGYDADGRRNLVTDALMNTTAFTYDAAGNQLSMTDANNHTTQYQYDKDNRRTTVVYADTTTDTTQYDDDGRTIAKTDQAGLTTQYQYDALGRLIQVTDALSQKTQYTYDEVGNRITQVDANLHTTKFEYDALGRRTKRTLPLGMSEGMTYDAAGNLKTKTDFNGKTTTYGYDPNNNWLTTKTPDPSFAAAAVQFAYTATGQRQSMMDASGTTSYMYDMRDRLTRKATPEGTLSYTYDLQGNLTSLASSNAGGASVMYTYDQLNRLVTVKDNRLALGTTTYAYDHVGNLQNYVYPNAVQTSYQYDSLNRLKSLGIANGSATTLASYGYTLGPAGNRTQVSELGGRTVSYSYDHLYRLTQETIAGAVSNNGSIGYLYDAVGNRQSRTSTVAAVPASGYAYDANDRLTTNNYDADGNTTVSNGTSYGYDFENHLTTQTGSTPVNVLYDGDGNRIAKTVSGVTTRYLVDDRNLTGHTQVVEELVSGTVQRVYTFGLNRISESQVSGTTFYGYDAHGSVRFLMNETGVGTDRYDYDAFGNIISQLGTTPNLYLYSGEQNDPNLDLYYLRARMYGQKTGRFITADELEISVFEPKNYQHAYVYSASNPVNRSDPGGYLSSLDRALLGTEVHAELGLDFIRETLSLGHDAATNIVPIWVILAVSGHSCAPAADCRKLPDLVDLDSKEVYEIKTIRDQDVGFVQLIGYLSTLNRNDGSFPPWLPGQTYVPPKSLPLTNGLSAAVMPPNDGVITYEIQDNGERSWISRLATTGLKVEQSQNNLFYATFGELLGAVTLVALAW